MSIYLELLKTSWCFILTIKLNDNLYFIFLSLVHRGLCVTMSML